MKKKIFLLISIAILLGVILLYSTNEKINLATNDIKQLKSSVTEIIDSTRRISC